MAIDVKEAGVVYSLRDMAWSTYEEGEDLIHEANCGLYETYEQAQRASKMLEEKFPDLPRGNWHIVDEIVYSC